MLTATGCKRLEMAVFEALADCLRTAERPRTHVSPQDGRSGDGRILPATTHPSVQLVPSQPNRRIGLKVGGASPDKRPLHVGHLDLRLLDCGLDVLDQVQALIERSLPRSPTAKRD